jgi:hypothetical protein
MKIDKELKKIKNDELKKEVEEILLTRKRILEKMVGTDKKIKVMIGMRTFKGKVKKLDSFNNLYLLTEQGSLAIIPLKKISVLEVEDYESDKE